MVAWPSRPCGTDGRDARPTVLSVHSVRRSKTFSSLDCEEALIRPRTHKGKSARGDTKCLHPIGASRLRDYFAKRDGQEPVVGRVGKPDACPAFAMV